MSAYLCMHTYLCVCVCACMPDGCMCGYLSACMSECVCMYVSMHVCASERGGNLLSFLLRCGTRPYERGTQ